MKNNKGAKNDSYKSGKIAKMSDKYFMCNIESDPLMFANSDKWRKMNNRNRKNRRK